ncbi:MAG: hypothetical protein LBO81_06110 [Clostridiales Family XIII bacterium]|jgi:hypothetical protein|nr:hypothetical protein [Clostridiales Family XIII bacterium]
MIRYEKAELKRSKRYLNRHSRRQFRRRAARFSRSEAPRIHDRYKIAAFAFWGVLALTGLISFLAEKPTVSDIENRPLEKPPKVSAAAFADGQLTVDFSLYYSDTFPLREWMIEQAAFLRGLRGVKGEDDVIIRLDAGASEGRDGNVEEDPGADAGTNDGQTADAILAGTAFARVIGGDFIPDRRVTEPLPDMDGERKGGVLMVGTTVLELYGFNEASNAAYADIVGAFGERHKDTIATSVMVAPTNVEFKIPDRYREMTDSQYEAISFIYNRLPAAVNKVWVYNTLAAHSDEDIYFRTDHHWTGLGAYYAYCEYARSKKLSVAPLESYGQVRHEGFLGSLYNSMGGNSLLKENPDYLIAYRPRIGYTMTGYEGSDMSGAMPLHFAQEPQEIPGSNKYLAYAAGDLPYVSIVTENKNGRRLLVIKESFANAMLPFLAENYEEIHVIDFRYYKGDVEAFVQAHAINEALFLNYAASAGSSTQVERLRQLFAPQ